MGVFSRSEPQISMKNPVITDPVPAQNTADVWHALVPGLGKHVFPAGFLKS